MVPLVNSGGLNIGFVNTLEMTDAFTGTGTFDGRPQENLRMVGVMFPIRVGLVRAALPDDLVSELTGVLAEQSPQMGDAVPLFRQLDPKRL